MGIFLSMTLDDETEHPVGDVLRRHYELKVSPEVAARHTMAIHREAARLRIEHRRSLRTLGRPRRAVVASLVGAMLVGSSTGALAASEETLPGDLLYGVKRTSEQARLFAAATFAREGLVHLDIARMRVYEAQMAARTMDLAVVQQLAAEAEAELEAAAAEGVPNVESERVTLLAQAEQAVEQSTIAAAVPEEPSDPVAVLPPSVPETSTAGAVPSASPEVSPSEGASPTPSASEEPPSEPETSTVTVPAPTPSPTP